MIVIDALWLASSRSSLDAGSAVAGMVISALLLLYAAFYTYVRPSNRIRSLATDAAILIIFSHVGCVFGYAIAGSPLPLQDELLARIDLALGFDWLAYNTAVFSSPVLRWLSLIVYNLTLPMVAFTVVWLSLRDRTAQSGDFVFAIVLGAVICISLSWFLPAAGAVGYYAPDEAMYNGQIRFIDLSYKQDYFDLRAGNPFVVSFDGAKGLVAFPSYHVCMAVLVILAFRGEGKRAFVPILIINVMTIISTPVDGGHHLSDAIGGALIGLLCHWLSKQADPFASMLRSVRERRLASSPS